MTLQGRNLQQGLTGTDIAALQTALTQLSYAVPATETQASSFGAGTLAAVQQFQTSQGLPSTGVVDANTAAAITTIILAGTYVVSGKVTSPVSAGVAGLSLQLVDKNVGGDVNLATGTTGGGGAYSISVVIPLTSLRARNKSTPDFQIRVLSGSNLLAASSVAYNAPLAVTLNVSLPAAATGLSSEYESLTGNLSALYKGQLSTLQENADRQDVTFLANKSGWDARAVALAALADTFSQITAPPATAPPAPASSATAATASAAAASGSVSAPASVKSALVPGPAAAAVPAATPTPAPAPTGGTTTPPAPPAAAAPVSLAPEFYYALFRAGLPADPNSLFRTPASSVQGIWQQAIAQGVIPQALSSQLPVAVQSYQTLAANNLLSAAPVTGVSTLSAMLTVSNLTAAQQTTFAQLYTQYGSDPATFWANATKSFGASVTARLQLDGQLHYMSLNNAPLVQALHSAEPTLAAPLDLVGLGYYNAAKWTPLIGASVPSQVPSAADYAQLLAAQVRLTYPTAVAGDQVKKGVFTISDTPAVATSVAGFLAQYNNTFFIGAEPVEAFLSRSNITNVPAAVKNQVKRLQRVYQMTSDDQTMSVMLQHNLDSAYAITRYDAAGFLRAFQGPLGGADNATQLYQRAKHIYSSVLNLAAGYLSARKGPTLGSGTTFMPSFPSAPANQTYPVTAYPTLESLFGSLDYCTCEDCRSILSPAAYLVDLLHYIDQLAPTAGYQNPQAVLFSRRPDLQYLPLTCENTNTALPYIDIVNETLEYFVANKLSIAGFQGFSTDDTVTSAELIASPQFVNDAAYTTLQNAYFPPPLPFNRPLEELRQLFQNMGPALADVMDALGTSTSTAISQTGTGYSAADILIEELGISRNEYLVFTDSTLGNASHTLNLQGLYGYAGSNAAVLATLQSITLEDFSRRTGVSYDDIVSILQTQFINPNAILIERLERLNVGFPALKNLQSNPSTAAAFIAGLPADLDARAYGGSYPTDYNAVVQWVINPANFTRIMSIITLSSSGGDPCSGSSFDFQYAGGTPLTAADFVKLIRFIRLWQKLGLSIELTDDILSSLYPAADLPAGTNDAVNIPLLDSGFKVAILHIGELFHVMKLLSLTPSRSVQALLACWAPIGTAGDNALYKQMFGGPAIQREDPGAPIASVGGGPNSGDVLTTTINSVPVTQTVSAGDTPASIAAKVVAAINSAATVDPSTGLPLNQRIVASSANLSPVVTIRAGFVLQCGPAAVFSTSGTPSLSQTATVAPAAAPGNVLTATINTVPNSYTVLTGDTPTTIAAAIASVINSNATPDPYSGIPLNSLLSASSSAGMVTIVSSNSGAPLALACSLAPGGTGSYSAGTATVGGTVATGDVLTTTINGLNVPFTVTAAQTTAAAVAAAIVSAIMATASPDPVSGLPLNSVLHASNSGATVTVAANNPATPLTLSYSATGAMTYAAVSALASPQIATVGGSLAPGAVLTTTINAVTLSYTVVAGDTAASIATQIASAINTATTVDANTNTALNQIVSAAAAAGVVTVTAINSGGPFRFAAMLTTGTYIAGVQPPPFADNGYGVFLSDPAQTVFGHEPVLRAAFNLTGAEFTQIANSLQFNYSTPLTLANISSIFRIGWLAHTLGISVVEFLLLRQTTGLDPFASLDPNSTAPVDPPVVRFLGLVQALSNAGLEPVQALYLIWNQDISGKSTPDVGVITGLAFTLRAAFQAVAAQFTIQTDPDGSIAQGLMTMVYGSTATGFYFGLLNNTLVSTVDYPNPAYPNPQPAPIQTVLDASGGRLSYDDLRKQLNFAGVLDPQTQAAIKAAIITNQNVPALLQALSDLATANSQMVGPFFSTYPELLPLYVAFVTSTAPLQQRRTTLLANFLPALIQKRNQEQALATVTSAAGTDPSFANVLLDDATVLHSAADCTAPIVNDLTALNMQGLAAQIFFSNNLSGRPDLVLDADPVSYAPSAIAVQPTASISGKITAGDVLTTNINGAALPYTVAATDKTAANVAAGIANAINTAVTPDPFSGLSLKYVATATASAGTVTVQASGQGANLTVACSVTPAAPPPTYTPGPQIPASQAATVGGAITVGDVLTTTINTIAVRYTVAAGDTSIANLAAHIAAAINATSTADPGSGLPLKQVVTAASLAGVITVTGAAFGPNLTLACSLSAGATETYTAGPAVSASQTATLSAVPPPNDAVVTTINSVAVQYTVAPADTTLAGLAANIAGAINANATVDSLTGMALNAIVHASSAGGVVTISTLSPGVSFDLSCSLVTGSYTLNNQAAVWQCAIVAGGIAAGDHLYTIINGITVDYPVTGAEAGVSALAAKIVAAIQATPVLNGVVSVASTGGIITFQGPNAFTLSCSTSAAGGAEAAEFYTTGPQFPAWQATVASGYSAGDVLTTTINDAAISYTIVPTDTTPATIAANIAKQINTTMAVDRLSNLPVNGLVLASSSGPVITFRTAGAAVVLGCSVSAGATEIYSTTGELPARPAGAPMAGIWSGYVNAPQDGFYNIEVETDPGAKVTLTIDGDSIPMTPSPNGSVWNNQGPIELTAGELTSINLSITSLQTTLTLNWQTTGLGLQPVPPVYLYSDTLMDRLQTAYVRFLKATSLAAALQLTANEIAFLGSSSSFAVNTIDKTDKLSPGVVTFTPASMQNIAAGSKLVIDSGPTQEVVTVASAGATSFTATIVNPHDGTATPFPIVDLPDASTGRGWLNLLPVSPIAGSSTAALQSSSTYTAGPAVPASQPATIGGTVKTGDSLVTTINGVATAYTVTAADTSVAVLAGHVANAINANVNPDPASGLPLNQAFSASHSGAVVTINAAAFGPDFTLGCSVSAGATETYTAGTHVQASQTGTLSGLLPAHEIAVTAVNGVAVSYAVGPTDTTVSTIASNIASAINATTTVDPITSRPLNNLVHASSAGGTITITAVSPGASFTLSCTIAAFRDVLRDILSFARIKAAVSPNDEQLLNVVEDPTTLSTDGVTPQIVKLMAWTQSSLNSLLQNFSLQLAGLSTIENLRMVFDAYSFVTTCRISAAALLAAATNAPTPATVASLQSALRALYAASDWLNVIQPVNDTLRIQQRDALVAYILQQLGDQYAGSLVSLSTSAASSAGSTTLTFASTAKVQVGMGIDGLNIPPGATVTAVSATTVTLSTGIAAAVPSGTAVVFAPANAVDISTTDDLYEYFLIDAETQPPVRTSRIRLALSTVQLFIERVLRNLEPLTNPTDIDGALWTWMKRYRVWQANREVFLWPENWLYPELRDDQSPIFQQMMTSLLQSDITDDAAAEAYLDYLSNLEAVAKLEPCGMYYIPSGSDTQEKAYVVARTAGAHRKYYFRELQNGSWMPWSEIAVECEDMPVTPVIWNGRLMLFWLKINKASTPQTTSQQSALTSTHKSSDPVTGLSLDDFQQFGANSAGKQTSSNVTVSGVLYWSEYYNGKWQHQKSSDVHAPAELGSQFDTNGPNSFDVLRSLITIVPVSPGSHAFWGKAKFIISSSIPGDALILAISTPGKQIYGGFVMYNTHSLPVRWEDVTATVSFGKILNEQVPISGVIEQANPGRTFQPGGVYTGGTSTDTFSIAYYTVNDPASPVSATTQFCKNSLLGLNRQPRVVDCAPNALGWDAPFLFEDRRNVFYVTTTETVSRILDTPIYGILNTAIYSAVTAARIPPLIVNTPAPPVLETPLAYGIAGGGDDTSAVSTLVVQDPRIHTALGTVTAVTYQGVALYPTGQVTEQNSLFQIAVRNTTTKPT